ncbi:hypothetical protein AALP_AA8G095700 [Arabis alpina]|uniref:cyanoalanine nitrilase n=1 Tax=Arabis alpina TaxID=50452 RepID=A0A087G605_ARAAL|nr:hypothetical protein AALP_AA8G095700 [Arabis alpina]
MRTYKAERLLAKAADLGSQLVVFPEAFIGGYPRGSSFELAIGARTAKGRDDFRKYHASAIDVPGLEVERLAEMAKKYKVFLVMGVIEKEGYMLYCTVVFFDSQGIEIYCAPTADARETWQASMTHENPFKVSHSCNAHIFSCVGASPRLYQEYKTRDIQLAISIRIEL